MQKRAPWLVATWGVGGTLAILGWAVWRLAHRSYGLVDAELGLHHGIFAALWLGFMLYTEAWRGFHKQFSPRVVRRAVEMPRQWPLMIAAPAVCMGLFHATPKRLLVSRGLVVAIVIMVILIRQVPSPWRELVDLGVTAGLAAGTLSVSWFAWRAARGHLPEIEADYPQGSPAS